MRNRNACVRLTWLFSILLSNICSGQEEASSRASDIIYDVPASIVFIKSADSHETHVRNALDDLLNFNLGWDGLFVKVPDLIDRTKPIVYYGFGGVTPQSVQMPLIGPEGPAKLARDPKAVSGIVPFALRHKIACNTPVLGSERTCHGIVRGGHLIAAENKWLEPKKLDTSAFGMLEGAKLLSANLDPRMRDFIDRASLGGYFRPSEELKVPPNSFAFPFGGSKPEFSNEEAKLFKTVEAGFEKVAGYATGLNYEERQFNAELHLKFARSDLFDEILDFERAIHTPFEPTIGLPVDDLLLSFSTQMSVFASPDSMKMMLKTMLPTVGLYEGLERDSALFEVTGNLICDSWEDISGVRVALYRPKREQFSVIAIFDAKNPAGFFAEIENLAAIVEPIVPEGLSEKALKEIGDLIEDLGAKKYSVRERAETRLSMAGRRAAPSLRTAIAESESAELRMRATRLLNRLDSLPSSAKRKLSNLNFWTNIDPDLAIERGTDTLFGLPARIMRIQLPADLTDDQVRAGTKILKQLFGEEWNRVPIVRVGDRFVAMFGSDNDGLKVTIDNLRKESDPVRAAAIDNAPFFRTGSLQIHASFDRINETFIDEEDSFFEPYLAKHPKSDRLSSVALALDSDYWHATFNMPVEEVAPCLGCRSLFDNNR